MARIFLAIVGAAYILLAVWCSLIPDKSSMAVGFTLQPQCQFGLSDIAQFDEFPDAYAAILSCGELADPLTHDILLWTSNPYR